MDLATVLNGIYHKHRALTPQLVVDYARPVDSPLHDRFEWDDAKAGEAYRKQQARTLIKSVTIKVLSSSDKVSSSVDSVVVRNYHSVRVEGSEPVYAPLAVITADEHMMNQVVSNAKRDFVAFWNKYRVLGKVSLLAIVEDSMEGVELEEPVEV